MRSILAASITAGALLMTPSQGATILAGEPNCVCTAQCAAYGDPHIIDFNGDTWKQTGTDLTLYKVDDFAVTVQTGTKARITSVNFGTRTYTAASDCQQQLQSIPDAQNLDADGVVSMELVCYFKDGEYIFDLYLNKTDTGSFASFDSLERNMGAGGLCLTGQQSSRRRLRHEGEDESRSLANTNLAPPTCVCQSICQAVGDPEVYGFYGGEQTVTASETITLYDSNGFSVKGGVKDKRIKTLYFGSQVVQASDVCHSTSDSVTLSYSWDNGNRIQALAQCEIKSSSNGYFFNVGIMKEDVVSEVQASSSTNFKSMETAEGSTGLCLQ